MTTAVTVDGKDTDFIEEVELEHMIGMTCNYTNSLVVHPSEKETYIYSIGPTLIINDQSDKQQKQQLMLRNHDTAISCLAVSPCGTLMASGQRGSPLSKHSAVVNLYRERKLVHIFNGLFNAVHQVLFTPDSKFLIGVDLNGCFMIWDCLTFETILAKSIATHDSPENTHIDCCRVLRMNYDQNFVKHNIYKILISYQCNLYLWTLQYSVKHMTYILMHHEKFAFPPNRQFNRTLAHFDFVSLAPDDQENKQAFLIAAGTNTGEVYLFHSSAHTHMFIDSFQACSISAMVVLFVDADTLIVGGGDGTVKKFVHESKAKRWTLHSGIKLDSAVNTLQFTPFSRQYLVATTVQSNTYNIDTEKMSHSVFFQSPCNAVGGVGFGTLNHIFATLTNRGGIISTWDLSTHLEVANLKYAAANGTALTYYQHDTILCGFDNGSMICLHVGGNKMGVVWEIKTAHRGKVNCMEICTDAKSNRLLLSGGDDGLLNVWNFDTQQLISQYHVMTQCVLNIIRDCVYAELIHILGSDGQIVTFSLKREGIVFRRMVKNQYEFGRVTNFIQNQRDEYELISSTVNGYILIWDQELTELLQSIDCKPIVNSQRLQITAIALSHNAKYLCIGSDCGEIFIIAMKRKQMVAKCQIHSHHVTCIAWTPDDKQIITSSSDASIAISNFY
eukprot:CAMPEP_0202695452 /NCGR_PEP_ID=MMETSP1385-20130828/9033_1 /ASSEMBLY_ACC=CAM_ASM_000861 /TAXON_ID=933848 /ORGANISM="Elphidium margaritaceum" /LENGTH=671 /DNA_ID=CAMNT_0049351475 /DNA_START=49 /DNA_END=2064 /DNA_ORIENTATION=-